MALMMATTQHSPEQQDFRENAKADGSHVVNSMSRRVIEGCQHVVHSVRNQGHQHHCHHQHKPHMPLKYQDLPWGNSLLLVLRKRQSENREG